MTSQETDFAGVVETLLFTQYFRVLDQRSRRPIVGDLWAGEVLDRIDFNRGRARAGAAGRFTPLLRARRLDDWTREFLAGHPAATVLHLGCGLDSRAFRVGIPDGVRWYDVDLPDVIGLRRSLYPRRDRYRMIAASVTDSGWLEEVPADRPVLVVAEGLLMYLEESDVRRLLGRLAGRFPGGELAFDGVAAWWTRSSALFGWALGDAREIERWSPRLALLDERPVVADRARIPYRRYRVPFTMMGAIPALRDSMRLVRYRIGDGGRQGREARKAPGPRT